MKTKTFYTTRTSAELKIAKDFDVHARNQRMLTIEGQIVSAEDCFELADRLRKLGHKLAKK